MTEKTFVVQCRDLEEGNGALWFTLKNSEFSTREKARAFLTEMRKAENAESLCQFRIVEVGSHIYYSQPTDRLEW